MFSCYYAVVPGTKGRKSGLIPPDVIEAIRNANPILDVVRDVELREKGRDWWGCCPFHAEAKPSFKVDPRSDRFHCFGCGADGDAFKYVMLRDGVSFRDAVRELGNRCGISIDTAPRVLAPQPTRKARKEPKRPPEKWIKRRFLGLIHERDQLREDIALCARFLASDARTDAEEHGSFVAQVKDALAAAYHDIEVVEYKLDIITEGSDEDCMELWKQECRENEHDE